MQKTAGLTRVGSGRAIPSAGRGGPGGGRLSAANGFHLSNLNYDGKIAGLYDLEETLGRGHFAVVKLARHVFTGEKVAVKVIDKTKLDEVSRAHLFQEVRCMKLVQHPNVVRLYEVIDTQTKLYLILELGDGGDLYDYIMRHENGLDQESARHYFRQVVHAISYCHQLHVVHRDLKPENVVFFEKLGMVKLTDFGFSNKYNPGQKLETSCGSLAYSAPEILLGDSYDAPAVDIWSLGVILYMLVCGHPPFQEANDSETLTMIMDCKYTVPPHVSEGCRRLIGRMLQRDPDKRANLEEIANDPWLQEGASASMMQPATYLPLVSREHLSEEDHALILQKMVNGGIASKEEILDALDKDEYNNITATYFLLAERKLRAQRQEQALMVSRGQAPTVASPPLHSASLPPIPRELDDTKEAVPAEMRMPFKASTMPSPLTCRTVAESLQGSAMGAFLAGRSRKYSAVDEEDESASVCGGGTGSGSESSRRSQRSSSNSLASQRTSNTSLASQRASNNSLAGSLRARGLLNNSAGIGGPPSSSSVVAIPSSSSSSSSATASASRSVDLRLEFIAEIGPGSASPKFSGRMSDHASACSSSSSNIVAGVGGGGSGGMEVPPAPFPTTSNIGLGLRSPRASPLTSPVTGHRIPVQQMAGSGRTTPASISPTSPSTPSSPGSSPTVNCKGGRGALPSPSRVLHAVRSSPQLILNEIFEEAESDSELGPAAGAKSPGGARYRNGHPPPPQRTAGGGCRALSAGPSITSQPNLVMQRRYEQRRSLVKARTASCSSSDASDNDDNEGRKKRAEKLHAAGGSGKGRTPPTARRDSHDDSSDAGGEGPADGAGISGGSGSSTFRREYNQSGSGSQSSDGAKERDKGGGCGGGTSGGRSHLLPEIDISKVRLPGEPADQEHHLSSRTHRFRPHQHHKGRRYTNAACSFSLLSPGLGSEVHLRASQSLSCLTEVCEEASLSADSPRIGVGNTLDVPDRLCPSRPAPTRSCSNLEKIEEGASGTTSSGLDSSSQELDFKLLLPSSSLKRTLPGRPDAAELESLMMIDAVPDTVDGPMEDLETSVAPECAVGHSGATQVQPDSTTSGSKKQKRLKQLFSRRDGSNSSFKKSDKRWSRRKSRGRSSAGHSSKDEATLADLNAEVASEGADGRKNVRDSDAVAASSSSPGRTMSFLRSRLYKARSLGSLVKERILVEASHCQYELWKRFGRSPTGVKTGDVNMNGPGTVLIPSPSSSKSGPPSVTITSSAELQQCCSISAATVLDSTC